MGLLRDLPDWDREALEANDDVTRMRGDMLHHSDTTGNAIRCNTQQPRRKSLDMRICNPTPLQRLSDHS